MSNVTLSVVVPSIDIIFEDDTAAILTAVDADTVLGVTPGTIGLQILATTTGDAALSVIGAIGPIAADGISRQAVAAHAMGSDPHPQYLLPSELPGAIDATSQARAVLAAHSMGVNPHPQYPTMDQMQIADADSIGLIMAHATSRSAHLDRPTLDQSILFSSFFGN